MTRKIISFDLGSTVAWADNYGDGLHWGHIEKPQGMIREHWLAMVYARLDLLFTGAAQYLDAVFYERPFARGQAATRMGWGLAGVIEAVASKHNLPCLDMPPSSIKKFAAGHGKAEKSDMLASAQVLFGYEGANEHEADAVCGLHYAISNIEDGEPEHGKVTRSIDERGTNPAAEGGTGRRRQHSKGSKKPRDRAKLPAGKRGGRLRPKSNGGQPVPGRNRATPRRSGDRKKAA